MDLFRIKSIRKDADLEGTGVWWRTYSGHTTNGGNAAFESLDGTQLYFLNSGLWRMPVSGGPPVKILDGVVWLAYTVIEKGIYYIDTFSGESRLQFYDFASAKSVVVARNLGDLFLGLTASPDGRTILYTRVDLSIDDLMLVENFADLGVRRLFFRDGQGHCHEVLTD